MADQSGPNAAYVAQLFADYLDAPASVPDEWRKIFDGNGGHEGNGHTAETSPTVAAPIATAAPQVPAAAPPPTEPAEVDAELLGDAGKDAQVRQGVGLAEHLGKGPAAALPVDEGAALLSVRGDREHDVGNRGH